MELLETVGLWIVGLLLAVWVLVVISPSISSRVMRIAGSSRRWVLSVGIPGLRVSLQVYKCRDGEQWINNGPLQALYMELGLKWRRRRPVRIRFLIRWVLIWPVSWRKNARKNW